MTQREGGLVHDITASWLLEELSPPLPSSFTNGCMWLLVRGSGTRLGAWRPKGSHQQEQAAACGWLTSACVGSGGRFNCILDSILRGSILSSWRRSREPEFFLKLQQRELEDLWTYLWVLTQAWSCAILLPGDWTLASGERLWRQHWARGL